MDPNLAPRIIFYFTATGNSLYAARTLGAALAPLGAEPLLLSIPQVLKGERTLWQAEEIGLVAPVYRWDLPPLVQSFLERHRLQAPYRWAVLTCGHRPGAVVQRLWRRGQAQGQPWHYLATVEMVDNFLPRFDMEVERNLPRSVERDLVYHGQRLRERLEYCQEGARPPKGGPKGKGLYPLRAEEILTFNERCRACRLCQRLCPRGNFTFQDQKMGLGGECEYCLACIHNCPWGGLSLKGGEVNSGVRYRHPQVGLEEIVAANSQLPGIRPPL